MRTLLGWGQDFDCEAGGCGLEDSALVEIHIRDLVVGTLKDVRVRATWVLTE